jgi:di/tricarboxylate transporter
MEQALAWISLAALLVVIVCSCVTSVNPGVLALAFAFLIGVYLDPKGSLKAVVDGFPTDLFLTLVGVTLLFTQAHGNGSLDAVARAAVRLCRGSAGLIPIMFFFLTFVLASSGAGNIAASALVAPMAMAVAERARIPAFLMTLMVAHGSLAGALCPITPTGIIADQQLTQIGLGGHEWEIYLHNILAQTGVAFAGYFLFGGRRLFRRDQAKGDSETTGSSPAEASPPLTWRHVLTLAALGLLIVGVICFKVHVGMGAFVVSVVLTLTGLADESTAVRKMPWAVILMVCGVTVLTAQLGRTGGTALFAQLVRALSTPQTVTAVIALFAGFVSVYASTSGVVLPAFLPIARSVGGDPLAVASSIIVAGHLVDSSPLSTIGAVCVACAPLSEDRRALFNKVLAWGLAMVPVGALICWVGFGLG